MMNTSTITLASLLGLLCALPGCDKIKTITEGAQGETASAEGPDTPQVAEEDPQAAADEKLGEKLSGYIDCINRDAPRVSAAINSYFSSIDRDKGPVENRNGNYPLRHPVDEKHCVEWIEKANAAEPKDAALEGSATKYVSSLKEFSTTYTTLATYYDEKDFKDDKLAKGRELHPKVVKLSDELLEAEKKLREEIAKRNDGLKERELTRIEKTEGRKLYFQAHNVMAKAKVLSQFADSESFKDIDAAAFEKALNDYTTALDEAEKYAEANTAEANSASLFNSFMSQAGDFRKEGKAVHRRKRDNKEFTDYEKNKLSGDPMSAPEGSLRKLQYEYNELVGDSNNVMWQNYKPNP